VALPEDFGLFNNRNVLKNTKWVLSRGGKMVVNICLTQIYVVNENYYVVYCIFQPQTTCRCNEPIQGAAIGHYGYPIGNSKGDFLGFVSQETLCNRGTWPPP
jgi:hypothetical protein